VTLVRKHLAYLGDDVRKAFPDDDSVNEALRVILKAAENLAAKSSTYANKRRRTPNYGEKTNCRVLAKSGRHILYATPIRQARRDLSDRVVANQRRLLQKEQPELKDMPQVQYVLQWREGDRWVTENN
jgi:hypothetical protein